MWFMEFFPICRARTSLGRPCWGSPFLSVTNKHSGVRHVAQNVLSGSLPSGSSGQMDQHPQTMAQGSLQLISPRIAAKQFSLDKYIRSAKQSNELSRH